MQKLIVLTLSVFIFFTSCSKDDSKNGGDDGEMAYASLTLTYSTGVRSSEGPGTPGNQAENYVNHIEVYIFDNNGNRETINDGYIRIDDWTDGASYMIPVTAGNKTFLVAANANLGKQDGKLEADIRALVNAYTLTDANSRITPILNNPAGAFGIPMAGEAIVYVAPEANAVPVEIGISRTFSKLQPLKTKQGGVTVTIPNAQAEDLFGNGVDPVDETKITFELESYYVINGITKSYAFAKYNASNEQDDWTGWTLNQTQSNYFASVYDPNGDPTTVYSGSENSNFWITSQDVFVYENSPKEVTSSLGVPGYDKKTACAMIIMGKLTYNGDASTTKIRYWRLNLAADYDYKLFRNVEYTITLTNITTKGYNTPEEAEDDDDGGDVIPKEGASVVAHIKINDWRTIGLDQGV